jgi:hypothetical protein
MPNQEKDDKAFPWSLRATPRWKPGQKRISTTHTSETGAKREKALGENIYGPGAKKVDAEGAKKIRPGDKNSTSANFDEAAETIAEGRARRRREQNLEKDSFLSEARKKILDRGSLTSPEKRYMENLI